MALVLFATSGPASATVALLSAAASGPASVAAIPFLAEAISLL